MAQLPTPNTASADTVRAMTPEMFFDYLSVRINREKAANASMTLNFDFGDDGKYMLELENGVISHTEGVQAAEADATVTLSRDTFNKIVLHETNLDDAIEAGDLEISGEAGRLHELISYLDTFELWFNIVTP